MYYIEEIVRVTGGSTFVLFTSYGLLKQCYHYLSERISESNITLFRQGEMDRHRLLEKYKQVGNGVLLGTDSFWQGVDVPGDLLRCVILARLPFRVPTEPIQEARVEFLEEQGRNSFMEYSVPQAVIKFKQGFGRLIRSTTDEGVVVCLDKRLITKSYGTYFLNSLPECNHEIGAMEDVLSTIRQYF
jgi:ATP-dependent DNA helicase DinG